MQVAVIWFLVILNSCSCCYGWKKPVHPIQIQKRPDKDIVETPTSSSKFRDPAPALGPYADVVTEVDCLMSDIDFEGVKMKSKFCMYQNFSIGLDDDQDMTVLGIFKGWEIENGVYKYMTYTDGMICGDAYDEDDAGDNESIPRFSLRIKLVPITADSPSDLIIREFKSVDGSQCHFTGNLHMPLDLGVFQATDGVNSPGVLRDVSRASAVEEEQQQQSTIGDFARTEREISAVKSDINQMSLHLQEAADKCDTAKFIFKAATQLLHSSASLLQDTAEMLHHGQPTKSE